MFTQSIPAVVDALNNVLPPAAIKALAQSLGNCNQPLTHRGQVNIQPGSSGNNRGVYGGKTWDPSAFKDILGQAGNGGFTDIPGYKAGDWNSVNYSGSQFFFPTDSYFNASNFYGGPTFNVGGPSQFDTVNANYITTNELSVSMITGDDGIPFRVNSSMANGGSSFSVTPNGYPVGGGIGGDPFNDVGSPGTPPFPVNMPWLGPPEQGGGRGYPSVPLKYWESCGAYPKMKKLPPPKLDKTQSQLAYLTDVTGSGASLSVSTTTSQKTFLTNVVLTGSGLTGSVSATSSVITYITAVGFNSVSCQVTSSTATATIYQPTGVTIGGSATATTTTDTATLITGVSVTGNITLQKQTSYASVLQDVTASGGGGNFLAGIDLKPVFGNKMILIPRNN